MELKINPVPRMPWRDYFMSIAMLVSERSTCIRRKVGAIAVKNKRILATGYNGAPQGTTHCMEQGCMRQQLNIPSGQRHEICRGLHAEQNIIIQAATYGIDISGADIYCTHYPCSLCAKMLINCKINRIYYADDYADPLSTELLAEAKIPLELVQTVITIGSARK